jgi:hypothetical protein
MRQQMQASQELAQGCWQALLQIVVNEPLVC